jgi:hypothetical protein
MRDDVITLGTTISPVRIEAQQACVRSWLDAGFELISVNSPQEIAVLEGAFPGVRFVPARRDGRERTGRPVPFVYDVVQALADSCTRHVGLVNSDILLCRPDLRRTLLHRPERSLTLGQRIDVDSARGENPHPQLCGIDLFVFDRSFVTLVEDRPFFFGVPWWDYWIPMAAALGGLEVQRLHHGPLLHVRHAQNWSWQSWDGGAREFGDFVDARLAAAAAAGDDNSRRAAARLATPWRPRDAPGQFFSAIVHEFVAACPPLVEISLPADAPCAQVAFREQMGYTIDRLLPGVSSHNNHLRPFCNVPRPLWGKWYTQVVASQVSPIEVEFQTAGKLFVLAGTDWDGGREAARVLGVMGQREAAPPVTTGCGTAFELFSISAAAGTRLVLPTQVMLVADGLSRLDASGAPVASYAAPGPANGRCRVMVSAARAACGAFSMFFQVLGHLRWAEGAGLVPVVYFNRHVCYWSESGYRGARNAWEYLFLPVADLGIAELAPLPSALEAHDTAALQQALADRAVVRDDYMGHDVGFGGWIDERQRAIAAGLVERYIRVRPEVMAAVDDFYRRHLEGHFVVGVHYRGTDKVIEAASPAFDLYRRHLDRFVAEVPELRIFAATDCAGFVRSLHEVYGSRVIQSEARRSDNGQPIHFGYARGAEEALIDVLLLARTHHFIHGVSNVSAAVLVFARSLPHTDLTREA